MNNNPFGNNPVPQNNSPKDKQIIAAWITVFGLVLAALIGLYKGNFGPGPSPTPTPDVPGKTAIVTQVVTPDVPTSKPVDTQYPKLHSSYRGTISDNTGVGNMQIDGLSQYSNGTFDAYGMLGSRYENCYITISGSVSSGGAITFESYQQPNIENSCEAVTAHYTGEVNSDGSNPRGRWSVTSSGQTGQWNLS